MTDYISREAAIEAMYKEAEAHPGHTFWTTQHEALRDIPAADVRPVVLCRDCKHWEYDAIFADGWCRGKHQGNPNWFCADGET